MLSKPHGEGLDADVQSLQLVFTALNMSKSAYACFSFAANRFFSKYHYEGAVQNRDKFFCKLYNRVCAPQSRLCAPSCLR